MAETKSYLSVTETATLIRQALKRHFPDMTFSVRSKSYSGGASVTISWNDGPPTFVVDPIAQRFAGADFDGMTDLKSYHSSVVVGEHGPREVQYGADFVFCNRHESNWDELVAEAEDMIRARCHLDESGKRFGGEWVNDLARGMARAHDYRDPAFATWRAFQRVVLRRRDDEITPTPEGA